MSLKVKLNLLNDSISNPNTSRSLQRLLEKCNAIRQMHAPLPATLFTKHGEIFTASHSRPIATTADSRKSWWAAIVLKLLCPSPL